MKARLIRHDKSCDVEGNTIEVKMWEVGITPDKPHGYKYSLVYIVQSVKYPATIIYSNISRSRIFPAYIVQGRRVIGYDNAEGKGDHRHYGDRIEPYRPA